ncbi:unnamed protein product [Notodromas monacha]|uniref:Uncharacterized protein n=1 Tax=Notodromas monacha TaxID=399045 RepID=A0A7R9BYD3_9CRUS|nr:unnamed protein product [Notodromas monacha]CAG0922698.1 unnamed protein product [Notodromas monacha]
MNDETGRRSVASVDESSASKIKFPAGSSSPTPTMTLDPPESPGITITVPRLLVDASPGQDHCNVDDDMECNNNCFREQHGREEQQQHHKQQEQEQQQLQQPQKPARFLSVPMAQLGRRRTSSATQESARAGLMLASVGVSHQSQLARSRTKRNLSMIQFADDGSVID